MIKDYQTKLVDAHGRSRGEALALPGRIKNLRCNLEGKFVSASPLTSTPGRTRVNFLDKKGLSTFLRKKEHPDKILATPM